MGVAYFFSVRLVVVDNACFYHVGAHMYYEYSLVVANCFTIDKIIFEWISAVFMTTPAAVL